MGPTRSRPRSPQLYSRSLSTSILPHQYVQRDESRWNFALDDISPLLSYFFIVSSCSSFIIVKIYTSPPLLRVRSCDEELESSTRSSPGSKFFTIICPLFKFITRKDLPTSIGKTIFSSVSRAHRPMMQLARCGTHGSERKEGCEDEQKHSTIEF